MEADTREEIQCILADVFVASRQKARSTTKALIDTMSSSVLAAVTELLFRTSSGGVRETALTSC